MFTCMSKVPLLLIFVSISFFLLFFLLYFYSHYPTYPDRFYHTIDEKITRENKKNLTVDTLEQSIESSNSIPFTTVIQDNFPIVISIANISYAYPTRPNQIVISNISLNLKKNTIHVIIGKSGSGKSTLLSLLCGLYQPTQGQITVPNPNDFSESSNQKLNLEWVQKNVSYFI